MLITPADGLRLWGQLGSGSKVYVAGSLRRGLESTHDIDLVVNGDPNRFLLKASEIGRVLNASEKGMRFEWDGIPVDVVFTNDESFGAAMLFYTGSKRFNIRCRMFAKARGLKLNRYGVFEPDGTRVAGETETECLEAIGLRWTEPAER